MGTRGFTGFRLKRNDKLSYQQFDSYLEGVGDQVVAEIAEMAKLGWDKVKKLVGDIRLFDDDTVPTPHFKRKMKRLGMVDLNVSKGSMDDMYCLLRNAQGHPSLHLQAGAMLDAKNFISDSLFCEWGYIINLDQMVLEVYKGYQHNRHCRSRYGRRKAGQGIDWKPEYKDDSQYFPVAMIKAFPLDAVPENWKDQCYKVMVGRGEWELEKK